MQHKRHCGEGGDVQTDLASHLPCGDELEKKKTTRVRMDASSPIPKKGMDFKWVSCWWNKLLRHPRGRDFSIPWVELAFLRVHPRPGGTHLLTFQSKGYIADTHARGSPSFPFSPARGWLCMAELGLVQAGARASLAKVRALAIRGSAELATRPPAADSH